MNDQKQTSKYQPFPAVRPEIVITESSVEPFSVDCRELPWWFGIPEVGDRTLWAIYDPPDWKLSGVTEMHAVRLAQVHDLDGVEINVNQWDPETDWTCSERKMYGRLTENSVQWFAIFRLEDGKRRLYTFLDEGFETDWGERTRRVEDRGRFVLQEDGSFKQQGHSREALGAGIFSVKIDDRSFTCLRVFDAEDVPREEGELIEAYLTREGRTVLCRRYNGRRWKRGEDQPTWDEQFPEHARIVIDGVMFVHWYDCLSDLACGIDGS